MRRRLTKISRLSSLVIGVLSTCAVLPPAVAQTATPDAQRAADGPSLITLHRQNASLRDVINDLAGQAGVAVQFAADANRKVTIDVDAQPFWQVLIDVLKQADAGFLFDFNSRRVQSVTPTVTITAQALGPVAVEGPLVAAFSQVRHWINYTEPADSREHCEIRVMVGWEPKSKVLFYESVGRPSEAVDEAGNSLLPSGVTTSSRSDRGFSPFGDYRHPGSRDFGNGDLSHVIRLQIPAKAGRKIARLKGVIRFFTRAADQTLEIKGLKAAVQGNASFTFAKESTLKLESSTVNDDRVQLQFAVNKGPGEADDVWHRRCALLSSATYRITTADGNDWSEGETPVQLGWGSTSVYYILNASRKAGASGAPDVLRLTAPADATPIDLAYDLKDLPLP